MDKYKKYDENIDIFPDVTIEAVEQIPELSETKIEPRSTQPRRKDDDIFNSGTSKPVKEEEEEEQPITIMIDEPTEIINDQPDQMETIDKPKRKGRGRAKKKYDAKPRTEKQLAVLEKARIARKTKADKKKADLEVKKQEIKPTNSKPVNITITPKEIPQEVRQVIAPPKSINDYETFCDYMNKYNANRVQMVSAGEQSHPNKIVNRNLLPRPPLIPNAKNNVEKIKKPVETISKPTNIYNPNYALNMLTNRRTTSRFKDPFSR
jgi:hypothetical protein